MRARLRAVAGLSEVDVPITAVFLVALRAGDVLAVELDRGWDIPGGHVEPGETLAKALGREVREEAGAA